MHRLTFLCLLLAIIYWFYRLLRATYNIISYANIRTFYAQALDIQPVRTFTRTKSTDDACFYRLERTIEYDLA